MSWQCCGDVNCALILMTSNSTWHGMERNLWSTGKLKVTSMSDTHAAANHSKAQTEIFSRFGAKSKGEWVVGVLQLVAKFPISKTESLSHIFNWTASGSSLESGTVSHSKGAGVGISVGITAHIQSESCLYEMEKLLKNKEGSPDVRGCVKLESVSLHSSACHKMTYAGKLIQL